MSKPSPVVRLAILLGWLMLGTMQTLRFAGPPKPMPPVLVPGGRSAVVA